MKSRHAGCVLDEAEAAVFRQTLKQQFVFVGSAEDLAPGDTVTLAFQPEDGFASLLKNKGFVLYMDALTRAYERK